MDVAVAVMSHLRRGTVNKMEGWDSDSIYDQHKMTALMFDRKNKVQEFKAASHISIITTTQMLI